MREPPEPFQWPSPRELAGELAVLGLIAVVLAALGPFGSFALGGFGQRLAYWVPASIVGYAIFRPIALLVLAAASRFGVADLPAVLVAVPIAAFPATAAMLWLSGMTFGRAIRMEDLLQLYFQVALIGGLIASFFVLISRPRNGDGTQAMAEPEMLPAPTFLERLPLHWNGRLRALEMEDHYVRAHGPDGQSVLILMRMADAERELAGADGARVHRSWWVMRNAVTGRRRDGRSMVLELGGGIAAPVARDRVAALKAAGWL